VTSKLFVYAGTIVALFLSTLASEKSDHNA